MRRIDTVTAVPDLHGPGKPGFRNGNKALAIPATDLNAEFFNAVQEENCNVIEAAGLTIDPDDNTQLLQAMRIILSNADMIARFTTTGNIVLNGLAVQAGGDWPANLTANDFILVKDQATPANNGWYRAQAGAWTRVNFLDEDSEVEAGMLTKVTEGATLADTIWMLTTDNPIDLGTTDLQYARKDSSVNALTLSAPTNLRIETTGTNATVSLTSDELMVVDANKSYKKINNVALAINSAAVGVNGLDTGVLVASTVYYVWVIFNPTTNTTAGIISLSLTAPTLPAGYTFKARYGSIRTDGSGNKYPLSIKQVGRTVRYKVVAGSNVPALPQMAAGVAGSPSTPTWVAVATGAYIPPTATKICIGLALNSNSAQYGMVAPNNNFGAYLSTSNPAPVGYASTTTGGSTYQMADLILESSNIYWTSSHLVQSVLMCVGWEESF